MKIRIEIDPQLSEPEVVVRCSKLDANIVALQDELQRMDAKNGGIVFYKEDTEYYLPLEDILFFETSGCEVWAHTKDDEFIVRHKLYELEELLPRSFIRISKSAILNSSKVYSIARNLTASSRVEFFGSHKAVFVSRNYYKLLKDKISSGSKSQ